MKFVPGDMQSENSPCRFIPLNKAGQTIDYFYRYGTQIELEEAVTAWLRAQIASLEQQLATGSKRLPESCGCAEHSTAGN